MNRFKNFFFIPMIFFFSISFSFGDDYYGSPEEYVGYIAQETLDILGYSEKKLDDKEKQNLIDNSVAELDLIFKN